MYELLITHSNGETTRKTVSKLLDVEAIAITPGTKKVRVTYTATTQFGTTYKSSYTIENNLEMEILPRRT
jgi:hypothetical protein